LATASTGRSPKKLVPITPDEYLKEFQKLTFFSLDYTAYADPSDDLKGVYDGDFALKDESGQRYNVKIICKFAINEAGKLIFGDHQPYFVQKIDAASVAERVISSWKVGDLETLYAQFDEKVVFKTDIGKGAGITSMTGTFIGHAGITDVITKQAAEIDFEASKKGDGTSSLYAQVLETMNDGKTAFMKYAIPLVYKNGAEYIQHFDARYEVNDFGKIVDYQFYETVGTKFEKAIGKQEL